MSNNKLSPVDLRSGLVSAVIGKRNHIEVTMDWTDFRDLKDWRFGLAPKYNPKSCAATGCSSHSPWPPIS
jgi:hypothetical protein